MNMSIASYAFNQLVKDGTMNVFGYLESCKYRYHLGTADIWNGMLTSTDEDYLKKVKEGLEERDLTLVNIAVDGASVWDPSPEVREKNYQNGLAHLKAGKILGAQSVRIDMGGREQQMSDEQFEFTVKRYQEYARIAEDYGFMMGPENHFGPARVPENIKNLYEAVNHPSFGILLHIGRWDMDVEYGDRLCAPWTYHVHLAVNIEDQWEEKIKMMLEAGYQGYWGIEAGWKENAYVEVERHLAAAQRALIHAK